MRCHVCWEKPTVVWRCCSIEHWKPRTLSVHISMVLSIRSVPPQSRAPLRSKGAHFEKRCPYGLPRLLGEAHSRMALLLHRALESRILSMQISMVLSIRSIPPQSRAHLRSKFAYFDKRCPYGLPCLLGEAHSRMVLLQHRALETKKFECAHLHGFINQICPTSKQGTPEIKMRLF
jgi:hypothetical protein